MNRDEVTAVFESFANIPEYGFGCGDGWMPLLGIIARDIAAIPDGDRKGFKVVQVKEKWGTLRFYYSTGKKRGLSEISIAGAGGLSTTRVGATGIIGEIVRAAEFASYFICEKCGKPGRTGTTELYVRTLCDEHAAEAKQIERGGGELRVSPESWLLVPKMLQILSDLWGRAVTLESLKTETQVSISESQDD